jgi:hypothetical protein
MLQKLELELVSSTEETYRLIVALMCCVLCSQRSRWQTIGSIQIKTTTLKRGKNGNTSR